MMYLWDHQDVWRNVRASAWDCRSPGQVGVDQIRMVVAPPDDGVVSLLQKGRPTPPKIASQKRYPKDLRVH